MSIVQDLADQLRVTREELPLAQVTAATDRLRSATGLLAWVLHHSSQPTGVPSLAHAVACLEHATAAIRMAQDAVDDYTLALGMPIDAHPDHDDIWRAALVLPAQAAKPAGSRVPQGRDATKLTDWWTERVARLTAHDGDVDRADAAPHSAELLRRCVSAALGDNVAGLHRHLTAAGPAVGLGLAAIAPPLLRHLATELVGQPPRLEDVARVRRAALPLVGTLLPELPSDPAEEIIGRVCHARPQRAGDRRPNHPVDAAITAALLVAGMLRATGRSADDLAQVTDEERIAAEMEQLRATERADSHRAALRITDSGRRRSAVDELGRPARPSAHRSGG
jgi:hypothetical protein